MKKLLLRAISVILVFVLSFTSAGLLSAFAADDEPEFPCGGVIEEVDVKILYTPLMNRIAIGGYGPILTGTVLKVTYPDGESEILTVEKNDNYYSAGDYSVKIFNVDPVIIDYGIAKENVYINRDIENHVGYSGMTDFTYLNLPSVVDIAYLISAYFRIWF